MSAAERFVIQTNEPVRISQELITPERAAEYLKRNRRNRRISRHQVLMYSELMRRDLWEFNGDAIRLTHDGELVDGQHRLLAIIASGRPQRYVVMRGISFEAFATVDTGKRRNTADVLSIAGYSATTGLSAGARLLHMYDNGIFWAENVATLDRNPCAQTSQTDDAQRSVIRLRAWNACGC